MNFMRTLSGIIDLDFPGEWCPDFKLWRRTFCAKGCKIELVEDLSAADFHGSFCLWPGGLLLAKFVECGRLKRLLFDQPEREKPVGSSEKGEQDASLAGTCVLELGAGLGLASMLAAFQGARVVCTERRGPTREFLGRNIELNSNLDLHSRLTLHDLEWGQEGAVRELLSTLGNERGAATGSQRSPGTDDDDDDDDDDQPFLVLAADVCYSLECVPLLTRTLLEVCQCRPQAKICLTQDLTNVPGGECIRSHFFDNVLPEAGFIVSSLTSLQALGSQIPACWASEDISVYFIRKSQAHPLQPCNVDLEELD